MSPATSRDLIVPALLLLAVGALAFSGVDRLEPFIDPVVDTWPALAPDEGAILFAGDNLLGDASGYWMKAKGDDWQFRRIESLLRTAGAAAVVVNQEGPVTNHGKRNRPNTVYNYRQPPRTMALFARMGVTHMSLANNHALDRELRGMNDTIKHATRAGIEVFGAGATAADSRKSIVIDVNGTRVAVIGGAQNWSSLRRAGWEAKGKGAGLFLMREELLQQVTNRARKGADLVVWYPHWGENYAPVKASQRLIARQLMDAGADAIVGHHSHEAQSFGWVGGRPVAWSLGNLVFGTPGRFGADKYGEGWGLLMRMVLKGGAIDRYEFVPMQINNRINDYQPHPLTASRSREVLKMYAQRERVPIRLVDGVGVLDATPPDGWIENGAPPSRKGETGRKIARPDHKAQPPAPRGPGVTPKQRPDAHSPKKKARGKDRGH